MTEPLAVVGMACRLPGESNSPTALWDFLERGGIARNTPPTSRFRLQGHEDGSKRPKTMRSPGGMFLENIHPADVDAQFFGLSKAEAIAMDPQQRQLLEVVYEGLENAGVTLDSLKGQPVGCFVGSYASDYGDIQARDPEDRAPNTTVGIGRAMLSNRLSHFLDINGPSMTIDTACSGSLVSLDVASRYLQTREINAAIVAGCNIYLSPEHCIDLSGMNGAASLSGLCHTFDAKADGYIKSEAVNMIIVKRLADAIRDNDPIRAVIRGCASNSDGWTAGIASPSSKAQAAATRQAYANAGISDFNSTTYLECHGTGTKAGDPVEVNGVASVFCTDRPVDQPLLIGSIKSNIGHSEPAAGISGMIKVILAMENGVIPGNPTFETPNPEIDFNALRVRASKSKVSWPKVPFRRASVNSFGYGGSNVHVILDEASTALRPSSMRFKSSYYQDDDEIDFFADEKQEGPHVLVFSANDKSSLKSFCKSLEKHLLNPRVNVNLHDLAYTLSERRTRHFHRGYVVTDSIKKIDYHQVVFGEPRPNTPRIGFAFTGQGSQWSQMGKSLVDTFPSCKSYLQRLDKVLQTLLDPPQWSLLDELTNERNAEHLRQPEFSQPLVTALQLALLGLLTTWGLHPSSVIGHSSGEIAAAASAGFITPEDAIKIAYYRGKAALNHHDPTKSKAGMLAVGLGADSIIQEYMQKDHGSVVIACVNSPSSVTLSGYVSELEEIKISLQAQGYFARLLLVDLAYHSSFMADIASSYKKLLSKNTELPSKGDGSVKMFSSVTGNQIDQPCDAAYWERNMTSPVLFSQAMQAMAKDKVDFLIEIGPSNTLSGPIKQIKVALGSHGAAIDYHAACKRDTNIIDTLFGLAGQLFLAGGEVDLSKVNSSAQLSEQDFASTLVDLPNYAWNHSTKYWYESESSKDWRFRKYPNHDLLGSKILGTSWRAPSWKKVLRTNEVTWLQDHRIGEEILFPAAGYMAMAVEALYQSSQSRGFISETAQVHDVSYRLRNVVFSRAIILEDGLDQRVMLTLTPETDTEKAWNKFSVSSLTDEAWVENCHGWIALQDENLEAAPPSAMSPFQYSTPANLWYKTMRDAGYTFGPTFQPQISIEAVPGSRKNRALLSFSEPPSAYPQSPYSVHPVALDGCLQAGGPALWQGIRTAVSDALVPAIIDNLVINSRFAAKVETGIAVSTAKFTGVGSDGEAKNYESHIKVYDPSTNRTLVEVNGLHYHKLDTNEQSSTAHTYMHLDWKPDISYITQEQLSAMAMPGFESINHSAAFLIDLLAHKTPSLKVIEFSMLETPESIWFSALDSDTLITKPADSHCTLATQDTKKLLDFQQQFNNRGNVEFILTDICSPSKDLSTIENFNLIIIRASLPSETELREMIANSKRLLQEGGYLLFVTDSPGISTTSSESNLSSNSDSDAVIVHHNASLLLDLLHSQDFQRVLSLPLDGGESDEVLSIYLCQIVPETEKPTSAKKIDLVHLSGDIESSNPIKKALAEDGFEIETHRLPLDTLQPNSTILVLDEIYAPVLTSVDKAQWLAIQRAVTLECKILWVTSGSQLQVTHPHNSLVHGMARVIRAEEPSMQFDTLDIESATSAKSIRAISKTMQSFWDRSYPKTQDHDNELVEREGIIKISRIRPNVVVNQFEKDIVYGSKPQSQDLHNHPSCVRMMCAQPGRLESLCFTEVMAEELPLPDDFVEVDMHAAGLNYKDVATCLGIVPENHYLLGLEGAGIIRRLGERAGSFHIGQRVLVYRRGSFGNKVQCPVEGVHAIPDWMSFEEAATLPTVYLAVIYGLYDLANIKKGCSVLIHSAAGGVGIAAIRICQAIGADIYATVGNEEKTTFLAETFNIPTDRIFSSRNTKFASKILEITEGKGVDIVLNSLTGDLLDESWRIVADCGTMVEFGKRDILDRNRLSMEPFNRNASYRAIDMSHDSITRPTVASLMKHMFQLIDNGHITPIAPRTVFPYSDIGGAIRYMRGGAHIGKIVISRAASLDGLKVPIRPALRQLALKDDVSYLIVGGLRGLCGSLAVYLARHGARHLVIMSRSGYNDEKSKGVLRDLSALGTQYDLTQGDVSNVEDVRRMFKHSTKPIAGIVHGAMVLKDKTYQSMTVNEFHGALLPKVQGTWNLHIVTLEQNLQLDFFTMLSSISGLVGQRGQANYAAGGVFLDSLASYRRGLGLAACSVDLGVIEDVGYISERKDLADRLDISVWTPINERLLHNILRVSIFQQHGSTGIEAAQVVTGITFPQRPDARLLHDARFSSLAKSTGDAVSEGGDDDALRYIRNLVQAGADRIALLPGMVEVVNRHFMHNLGLTEPMEPAKPLTVYGLDSLVAVEFRNWMRQEMGVGITTLEIVGAKTLSLLCEKIVDKIVVEADKGRKDPK